MLTTPTKILYEQDYYLWIQTTLQQLQQKQYELIDWDNLLEEIDSLGKQQQQELENRLLVLLEHLLKLAYWQTERDYNARGWKGTIIEQRKRLKRLLRKNPSLQPYLNEVFSDCYQDARDIVITKTGLAADIFPVIAPFSISESLDENWYLEM